MDIPIHILAQFLKHLKYSQQRSLRTSCKALYSQPIINDDKLEYINQKCIPTVNQIVNYIFEDAQWWVKDYSTLQNKDIRFIDKSKQYGPIVLVVRKSCVYYVNRTKEFSHYKHGRPCYIPRTETQQLDKIRAISHLQTYELDVSPGGPESKIYDSIFKSNQYKIGIR